MPQVGGAGRASRGPTRSQQLALKASKKAVRPVLGLRYYYRSAEMLLRQADSYRRQTNQEELYVILMRYASLVLETIPEHADFRGGVDPKYKSLKAKTADCIEELERLKLSLDTKPHPAPVAASPATPDVVKISGTTMLTEADWSLLRPPINALPRGDSLSRTETASSIPPPPPQQGLEQQSTIPPPPPAESTIDNSAWMLPPDLTLSKPSEAALQRHCLVGPMTVPFSRVAPSSALPSAPLMLPNGSDTPLGSLYNISVTQSAPVALQQNTQLQPQPSASEFQDPLVQELASMQMPPQTPLIQQPQLGPQMVEIIDMAPPNGMMGPEAQNTCSSCPPPPEQEVVLVRPSPEAPKEKVGIKDVHISVALMEEFMRHATSNTRKGIETCGILAGKLDPKTNVFTINTLIVPHQEGTRDTVTALNEEDIFMAQDERGLFPLGWIHTHPTQTCFLSSVDVHTQVGYQTLLDEAVAIVMAPTDRSKRCGIFRLTTPGGLKLIQRCPKRGFHTHPDTHTGQPIYELCGHVYLNPRIKMEIIDLRK